MSNLPKMNGKIALALIAVVAIVGAIATVRLAQKAEEISLAFSESQTENQTLVQRNEQIQAEMKSLETQFSALEQKHETIMIDRDNLLSQAKRLMNEQVQVSSSSELYEQAIKRAIEQNWQLKGTLEPMEQELEALQGLHDALLQERDALDIEVAQLRERMDKEQFQEKLEQINEQRKEQQQTLRQARKQIKLLESRKAATQKELSKVEDRFESLQEKYTKLLAENKEMRFHDKHLPHDVTIMAKEHERLIRNLADTHYNMGVLFTEKNDYVRAVKEFQKVIELRPDDTDALYNLGLIYAEHLPNRDQAMQYFNQYLQFNPDARDASWVKQYIVSWRAWDAKELLE